MTTYKLQYFDGRGRGEVIRMLLSLGGKKFEDVRYSMAQWGDVKKGMWFSPFKHLLRVTALCSDTRVPTHP